MTLPNAFKIMRDSYDASQIEISKLSGMSQSSVSAIESNSSNPTLSSIIRYASALTSKWKIVIELDGKQFVLAEGNDATVEST